MSIERLHAAIERHKEATVLKHLAETGLEASQHFDTETNNYFRYALLRMNDVVREIEQEFGEMLDP